MKQTVNFSEEQYQDYVAAGNCIDFLYSLGLNPFRLMEPPKRVHEQIMAAHRAGHNTLEISLKQFAFSAG